MSQMRKIYICKMRHFSRLSALLICQHDVTNPDIPGLLMKYEHGVP